MATFNYVPSSSTSVEAPPRIRTAKFGDGYEQNTFDGINHTAEMWNLTFANIDLTTATAISNFFKNNNAATTPFDWTTPDGNTYRFLCKQGARRGFDTGVTVSLTCTFQQVFW